MANGTANFAANARTDARNEQAHRHADEGAHKVSFTYAYIRANSLTDNAAYLHANACADWQTNTEPNVRTYAMADGWADDLVDYADSVSNKYAHSCANNRPNSLAYSVADRSANRDAHETTF
jgi:hypothetical protein